MQLVISFILPIFIFYCVFNTVNIFKGYAFNGYDYRSPIIIASNIIFIGVLILHFLAIFFNVNTSGLFEYLAVTFVFFNSLILFKSKICGLNLDMNKDLKITINFVASLMYILILYFVFKNEMVLIRNDSLQRTSFQELVAIVNHLSLFDKFLNGCAFLLFIANILIDIKYKRHTFTILVDLFMIIFLIIVLVPGSFNIRDDVIYLLFLSINFFLLEREYISIVKRNSKYYQDIRSVNSKINNIIKQDIQWNSDFIDSLINLHRPSAIKVITHKPTLNQKRLKLYKELESKLDGQLDISKLKSEY